MLFHFSWLRHSDFCSVPSLDSFLFLLSDAERRVVYPWCGKRNGMSLSECGAALRVNAVELNRVRCG
jgi:hypothetical protein